MSRPQTAVPDGLEAGHTSRGGYWRRHASPLALLILGLVVLTGISGALGRERSWLVVEDGVTLEVHAPEVLRNGEFFEMRIAVGTVDRAVDALVIGVTQDLWTDMTVNTMIPAASEESSRGGEMRFTFGHLDPGAAFLFKVDLQANPDIVLGNSGRITVYDGDRTLVSTELGMAVLP